MEAPSSLVSSIPDANSTGKFRRRITVIRHRNFNNKLKNRVDDNKKKFILMRRVRENDFVDEPIPGSIEHEVGRKNKFFEYDKRIVSPKKSGKKKLHLMPNTPKLRSLCGSLSKFKDYKTLASQNRLSVRTNNLMVSYRYFYLS